MPNGKSSNIINPFGDERIIQPGKPQTPPQDNGTALMVDPDRRKVIGKRLTTTGLVRLVCLLIEKKCDGLFTVAAKDIEGLKERAINFNYNLNMDIFDIAITKKGEPNPFAEVETEDGDKN